MVLRPVNGCDFLLSPLAKAAGGTKKCGQAVFTSTNDPAYQKIIKTFEPTHEVPRKRPRADMNDFTLLPDET